MRSSRAVISGRNKHCPQLQRGAPFAARPSWPPHSALCGRRTLHFAAAALCTLRPSHKGFGRSRTAAPKLRLRRSGWAPDGSDARSAKAFISHRASAEMVRRQKRHYAQDSGVAGAPPNPLEAQREVCELSPDCDELADQIGFQEAYRRFYGPV
ncbi:osteocalcin isoform X1 [Gallus gallus]|nr:osteocalcin isoform X1 [Gallus gallus]